jgi:hypothetical protein
MRSANEFDPGRINWAVCPAPGDCVAAGTYPAQDGSTRALIETATGKHG